MPFKIACIQTNSARELAPNLDFAATQIRAARETGGTYILVSDNEILQAIAALGPQGIFAEPAGATAYAGLVKAIGQGIVDAGDPVLVLNTGSGLKDVRAAMQAVKPAPVIEPTLEALKRLL